MRMRAAGRPRCRRLSLQWTRSSSSTPAPPASSSSCSEPMERARSIGWSRGRGCAGHLGADTSGQESPGDVSALCRTSEGQIQRVEDSRHGRHSTISLRRVMALFNFSLRVARVPDAGVQFGSRSARRLPRPAVASVISRAGSGEPIPVGAACLALRRWSPNLFLQRKRRSWFHLGGHGLWP